jgi:uncharacterized integral membrane protein
MRNNDEPSQPDAGDESEGTGTTADKELVGGDERAEPTSPLAGDRTPSADQPTRLELERTRTASTWAAVVVATVTLIVLLVFILQNLQTTTVTFLGITGNLPVGIALLLAAAIGGLLVALVGAARILQLRRTAQQHRKHDGVR